jgi:hypothetical protein
VQSALVPREWLIANKYLAEDKNGPATPVTAQGTVEVPAQTPLAKLEMTAHAAGEASPLGPTSENAAAPGGGPISTALGAGGSTGVVAPVAIKRQAPRRKRWHFAVMAVQDASKHNSRSGSPAQLQAGDVVLEVDGRSTAGLTFQQAVALLRDFGRVDEDGVARCPIVIARRRAPVVAHRPTLAPSRPSAQFVTRKTPLNSDEMEVFVSSVLKSLTEPSRILGKPLADNVLRGIAQGSAVLSSLSLDFMKDLWKGMSCEVRAKISANAIAHWIAEWQNEPQASRVAGISYMTDAQRATLRSLPRPAKGCRCGAEDHEYVDNVRCPLYSNLRSLAPPAFEDPQDTSSSFSSKLTKDLNAVEKAFKDRYVKMKSEQKAQEKEAKFVAAMEDVQLQVRKQAIFAPSLQCMVLSAVAESQHVYDDLHLELLQATPIEPPNLTTSPVSEITEKPNEGQDEGESDDDDDNVPLAQLGKRALKAEDAFVKRAKREVPVRLCFIARLLKLISFKWGHVYREPTDEEHAWYVPRCCN